MFKNNLSNPVAIIFALIIALTKIGFSQTVLIDPNGDGGFQNGNTFAANGWTASNSVNNPWLIGTAINTVTFSGHSDM